MKIFVREFKRFFCHKIFLSKDSSFIFYWSKIVKNSRQWCYVVSVQFILCLLLYFSCRRTCFNTVYTPTDNSLFQYRHYSQNIWNLIYMTISRIFRVWCVESPFWIYWTHDVRFSAYYYSVYRWWTVFVLIQFALYVISRRSLISITVKVR